MAPLAREIVAAAAGAGEDVGLADAPFLESNFARGAGRRRFHTFAQRIQTPEGVESIAYGEPDTKQYIAYLEGMGRLQSATTRRRLGEASKPRRLWMKVTAQLRINSQRWLATVVVGLGTGLIAVFVYMLTKLVFNVRLYANQRVGYATHNCVMQYFIFVAMSVAFASVAGFLVCYVQVLAAGSGIPEIKCFLNGIRLKDVVSLSTLVAKSVGISFSVGAGLPCGKEGPMIHSGAILGGIMARTAGLRSIFPLRLAERQRDMVAAGAAAGVAAAFCAPLGGVLFAIEEGASHMNPELLLQLFVCCAVAAFISRFMLSGLFGDLPWGELGNRVPVEFGHFADLTYSVPDLLAFALVGVGGGLLGASFVALNKRLTLWRKRHISPTGTSRFLEVLVITFLISTLKFWIVIAETGGAPAIFSLTNPHQFWPFVTQDELENLGLWVNETRAHNTNLLNYEDGEALSWLPGAEAMRILFHSDLDGNLLRLFVFAVFEYFTTCLTYGAGVPSGLFVPSLLTGAAFGRLFGEILRGPLAPLLPLSLTADRKVYALVGSVAFLSGAGRITISLAVILMEATGDAVFGLPLFLASMCARWTGNAFGHGIYDMHIIEMKRIPLLEYLPSREMIALSVSDAMSSDVVAVEQVERVGRLVEVLQSCKHNGFPVLYPGTRRLAGMIERKTLRTVLNYSKSFDATFQPLEGALRAEAPMVPYGLANWEFYRHPEYEPRKEDADRRVDLSPYVDRCGYSVTDWSSLMSCFRLFRQLGLRHLPVLDSDGNVCGVVTRKDLILAAEDGDELKEDDPDVELSMSDTSSDEDNDDSYSEGQ